MIESIPNQGELLTEPDVTLTDYALFLLCSFFAWQLWKRQQANQGLKSLWIAFFASIALASFTGGTVHGFFLDESTLGFRFLWPVTLIAIGVTAATVWMLAGLLLSGADAVKGWKVFAAITFAAYSGAVLFYSQSFTLVIFNYLPAMLALFFAALKAFLKGRDKTYLSICFAILMSLVAAGVQQAGIALHPLYFNHNSTYHLIQAFGLWIFYLAARKWVGSKGV